MNVPGAYIPCRIFDLVQLNGTAVSDLSLSWRTYQRHGNVDDRPFVGRAAYQYIGVLASVSVGLTQSL